MAMSRSGTTVFTAAKAFGYTTRPAAVSTTVTNSSRKASSFTVALTGAQAGSFDLSARSLSIAAGRTGSFTVRPKAGLARGTHNATVVVTYIDGTTPVSMSFNVRFAVTNRGPGAKVSRVPVDNKAARTPTSLTVNNNVGIASNKGGQVLQFAITTNAATTPPKNLKWQAGRTFNNLKPGTRYYIWARTAQNNNCNAGPARRSAVITTPRGITLNRTGTHTFAAATMGYGARPALSVNVKNVHTVATGVLTVRLVGGNTNAFSVSTASLATIAVGKNRSFTVAPRTGLAPGTYSSTVRVSRGSGFLAEFKVSFTVNPSPGTAVSNAPAVKAVDANSIEVFPVLSTNTTNQPTVQYAISTGTGVPAAAAWRTFTDGAPVIFGTLNPGTTYYVFARTVARGTFAAGTALRSEAIQTERVDHSINLSFTGTHTFTAATHGYGPRPAFSVTATNTGRNPTGDLSIAIAGTNGTPDDSFVLSTSPGNTLTSIPAGSSRTFTIRPDIGLRAGVYTATVTVSNDNVTGQRFNVSFTVNANAGATVRRAPTLSDRTETSITVNSVAISGNNPGGQTVEYAISRFDIVPTNGWQPGTTFNDLDPAMQYYVFARAAATDGYNAGPALRSPLMQTNSPAEPEPPPEPEPQP